MVHFYKKGNILPHILEVILFQIGQIIVLVAVFAKKLCALQFYNFAVLQQTKM